ncbi:Protein BIG GRAIN 1 [Zea mays]|uniref:Protein BIG GRAIN 1 n=1 Tax=Zea mays TaxID=4577 RepID=A0A3L6DGA7_MAIZE|nr:Protein BIG GRAIN 1 [Zea mays]
MERWRDKDKGAAAPAPGRARRYGDQPSFSSTLLDAIYKSMDEPDGGVTSSSSAAAKKQNQDLRHSCCYYKASLAAGSYRGSSRAAAPRRPQAATTSSSSDQCSSYGGFSSSEAESSQHRRLRPIRTSLAPAAVAVAVAAPAPEKKKAGASIRARLRDLRRKPASPGPGARLAGFLNAIFSGRRAPPSASSCSRSCLSETPSTRGQPKRTVRFLDSGGGGGERRRTVPVGVAPELEQMLLHGRMEVDSDEDDDESSDASSDLFDLENFAAVDPDGGAAYSDELPVYETTRLVLGHRAIGHGYARTGGVPTRVV